MALAMSFIKMVLPVLGCATIKARWPLPMGANKYYYTDLGLRNARLNYRQYDPGHIMENIIYNELVKRGYSVDVGVVTERKKTRESSERLILLWTMETADNFYDDNGFYHYNLIDFLLGTIELF